MSNIEREELPLGILGDFTHYILSRVPTSYEWAELQALGLLSTMMGLKREYVTTIGPMKLNIFALNCGPSRIAFKTVPVKYYTRPILDRIGRILNRDFMMPEEHTTEAMVSILSRRNRRTETQTEGLTEQQQDERPLDNILLDNEGMIIYDEISTLFKDTKNKKYMSGGIEFLSKMYDGYVGRKATRSYGLEGGIEVYVPLLAMTTPSFFKTIDKTFIIQGMGNRFFYVVSEPQELLDYDPVNFYGLLAENNRTMNDSLDDFAERLAKFYTNTPTNIDFTGTAARMADEYRRTNHTLASESYRADWKDLTYSYMSERHTLMLKLASLHAVSSNEEAIISGRMLEDGGNVIIGERSVTWAMERMEVYTKHFMDLLNLWPKAIANEGAVYTLEADIDYMRNKLKDLGGKTTHTTLRRSTKYNKNKFYEVVNTMVEMGMLEINKGKSSSQGGKAPIIYKLIQQGLI